MKDIVALERKTLDILSKKVCTYGELELELHKPSLNIKDLMNGLKAKKKVKNISAGCRQIFFTKESQRLEADVKALGKYALGAYRLLKEGGPMRGREILQHLGVRRADHLGHSMDNLVSNGYVKFVKADDQRDGDIYYICATKEQLRVAKLSLSAQKAYKIIQENKFPIHSAELAERMETSVFNASGIAKRLVKKGFIFEPELSGDKSREKTKRACFYTNPSQDNLATIMTISPQYGVKIYQALDKRPRKTNYISNKVGIPREQTFQVLARMKVEGLAEKILGRPDKWYLAEGAPKLYLRRYKNIPEYLMIQLS